MVLQMGRHEAPLSLLFFFREQPCFNLIDASSALPSAEYLSSLVGKVLQGVLITVQEFYQMIRQYVSVIVLWNHLIMTEPKFQHNPPVIMITCLSMVKSAFWEAGLGFNGAQMIYYLILRHVQTTKNCLKSARHWIPMQKFNYRSTKLFHASYQASQCITPLKLWGRENNESPLSLPPLRTTHIHRWLQGVLRML